MVGRRAVPCALSLRLAHNRPPVRHRSEGATKIVLLVALAAELSHAGELDARQVAAVATAHGVDAAVRPEGYMLVHPLAAALDGTNT